MSQLTYACTVDGCGFVHTARGAQARRDPAVAERRAHAADAHDGDADYVVTERWAWMPALIVVNLLTLVVSTIAAIGSVVDSTATGPLFLVGMMFPQVWGWFLAPWVGVITVAAVSIAAWIYAAARPRGTRVEQRFAAGVTMGAFVAAVTFPVVALSLLALVTRSLVN